MSGRAQKCENNAIFSKTSFKYCLLILKWPILVGSAQGEI